MKRSVRALPEAPSASSRSPGSPCHEFVPPALGGMPASTTGVPAGGVGETSDSRPHPATTTKRSTDASTGKECLIRVRARWGPRRFAIPATDGPGQRYPPRPCSERSTPEATGHDGGEDRRAVQVRPVSGGRSVVPGGGDVRSTGTRSLPSPRGSPEPGCIGAGRALQAGGRPMSVVTGAQDDAAEDTTLRTPPTTGPSPRAERKAPDSNKGQGRAGGVLCPEAAMSAAPAHGLFPRPAVHPPLPEGTAHAGPDLGGAGRAQAAEPPSTDGGGHFLQPTILETVDHARDG